MRSHFGYRAIVVGAAALLAATQVATDTGALVDGGGVAHASSACADPADPADPVTLSSVAQVELLVVGTWIRCDGPSQFGEVADGEVGVVVGADGRFYRVFEATDGTLVRAEGVDQEGAWTVLDLTNMNGPGHYQLNWTVLGRGTFITAPTFFESPPSLRLLDSMRGPTRLERWTGAAPIAGLPPGDGDERCGHPTQPITPVDVEQVRDLLVGTWTRCGDASVVGDPAGDVGLEFGSDGRFHRLVRAADGTIIRGAGAGLEGTWIVYDTEGSGIYQVDLQVEGRGVVVTLAVFLASPPFVRFTGFGIVPGADYLRGEPPADMPGSGSGTTVVLLTSAALITLLGVALRASSRLRVTPRAC